MTAGAHPPAFWLYGFEITLFPSTLEAMAARLPHAVMPHADLDELAGRIKSTLADVLPGGVTAPSLTALAADTPRKDKLLFMMHLAAIGGLYAYPVRQPAPQPVRAPSGAA